MTEIEQRTSSWEEWRRKGVCASDAPVIMKVSPYRTPYQIWTEKLGIAKPQETNFAMERGNQLEPKARAYYETIADVDMPACLVVHPQYSFVRASLDGFNPDLKKGLEIKCPMSRVDHETALGGQIPTKYYPQVQHQMFAAQAEEWDYFSYFQDDKTGDISVALVTVTADKEYQAKLLEEIMKFWALVETKTPPALLDDEFKELEDDASVELFTTWKKYKLMLMQIEDKMDQLKSQIIHAVDHPRVKCAGVSVVKNKKGVTQLALNDA
jgi:putative phage-type endonuclease